MSIKRERFRVKDSIEFVVTKADGTVVTNDPSRLEKLTLDKLKDIHRECFGNCEEGHPTCEECEEKEECKNEFKK